MEQLLDVESIKKLTPDQQFQVLSGIKQQAAIANAQNLITAISDKCTNKCITIPGSSLSGSEKQCLQRCMDRFIESWNIVSITLQKRLQQENLNFNKSSFSSSSLFTNDTEPTFS